MLRMLSMTKTGKGISDYSPKDSVRFFVRAAKVGVSLAAIISPSLTQAAESAAAPQAEGMEPLDFTGLSLEELLQAEITPINVLGSHTHLAKEFMVGYRFAYENWDENLVGTRRVTPQEVLAQYPLHHTFMTMEMHMIELMYAPSDDWTLMAMGHYMSMDMGHLRRDGSRFISHSSGFGDTELMALYNAWGDPRGNGHRLVLNGGISLPTGSIDKDFNGSRLEYMMQLGSGTFDLLPGLTYLGQTDLWSWGAQAAWTVRLGENENDYRLGNAYRLGAWAHYKLREWVGPSLRVEWNEWGNIHGRDPAIDPTRNPAFDARLQKGKRLDVLGGIQFYVDHGPLKGLRFGAEAGVPIYEDLAGPNLATEWLFNCSLSYVFR